MASLLQGHQAQRHPRQPDQDLLDRGRRRQRDDHGHRAQPVHVGEDRRQPQGPVDRLGAVRPGSRDPLSGRPRSRGHVRAAAGRPAVQRDRPRHDRAQGRPGQPGRQAPRPSASTLEHRPTPTPTPIAVATRLRAQQDLWRHQRNREGLSRPEPPSPAGISRTTSPTRYEARAAKPAFGAAIRPDPAQWRQWRPSPAGIPGPTLSQALSERLPAEVVARLARAVEFARLHHGDQRRPTGVPYLEHLLEALEVLVRGGRGHQPRRARGRGAARRGGGHAVHAGRGQRGVRAAGGRAGRLGDDPGSGPGRDKAGGPAGLPATAAGRAARRHPGQAGRPGEQRADPAEPAARPSSAPTTRRPSTYIVPLAADEPGSPPGTPTGRRNSPTWPSPATAAKPG